MTAIAWQWSWPGLNTPLLVSKEAASVLESYRQKRFEVERGGQLFVDPSSSIGLVLTLATPSHKDVRYSPMSRPNNHKIKIELG